MLREIELFEALRRDDLSTVMSSQYQRVFKTLTREDTPEFILPNPSTLMVAAYFGSIHCFNFLITKFDSLDFRDVFFYNFFNKELQFFLNRVFIYFFIKFLFLIYRHVLHFAAAGGNMEIFNKLMIKKMPKINNEIDQYQNTPLHYAAKFGRVSIVRLLCSHGVNVKCRNIDGFLPSHYAAICGSLPILQILQLNGDSLTATNYNKWTPLHYAIKYQHQHIIDYLLQIDSSIIPPLTGENDDENVNSNFPKTQYSPNSYDVAATLVQLAATYGSTNLVESIITKIDGFDSLNHNGWNLLHFAAANGIADVFHCAHNLIKSDDIFYVKDRNQRNLSHIATISDHLDVLITLDELNIILYNEKDKFGVFFF